ncbi:MAG: caspase family protein [Pseudomonadota bacterium]
MGIKSCYSMTGFIDRLAAAVGLVILLTFPVTAFAQSHVALVIGNSQYTAAIDLKNPKNDAEDIADKLDAIGYDVTERLDASAQDMRLALGQFRRKASQAEVAVVYYAGHGIQIADKNYLLPVDVELENPDDAQFFAIPLNDLLLAVKGAKKLQVVMLDACRDNPFEELLQAGAGQRSMVGSRGLASIDKDRQPSGSVIGFAAEAGKKASDGAGRNSPYAEAILANLDSADLEVGRFFRKLRSSVDEVTNGEQTPVNSNRLSDGYFFIHPNGREPQQQIDTSPHAENGSSTAVPQRLQPDPLIALERRAGEAWKLINDSDDRDDIEVLTDFTDEFEGTFLARRAVRRIERLQARQKPPEPEPPLEVASVEPPPVKVDLPFMAIYQGLDFFGGDLTETGVRSSSANSCARLCGDELQCRAFTYVSEIQKCFLKRGYEAVDSFKGAVAGIVFRGSGIEAAPVMTTDWDILLEQDLRTSQDLDDLRNIDSFRTCRTMCSRTRGCRAVTYSAKLDRCWLKDTANIRPVRDRNVQKNRISSAISRRSYIEASDAIPLQRR